MAIESALKQLVGYSTSARQVLRPSERTCRRRRPSRWVPLPAGTALPAEAQVRASVVDELVDSPGYLARALSQPQAHTASMPDGTH